MQLTSSPGVNRLTPDLENRLNYIAHCGPVFRTSDDDALVRMRLVRPFRRIRGIVEATRRGLGACDAADETSSLKLAAS